MDLLEAIEVRQSRRKYRPTALPDATVASLRQLIEELNATADVRLELVLDNGTAFEGLHRSYGMFSGVRHYVGLIADKRDATSPERLGYTGELVNLTAVTYGLGTCIVGGSFDRAACPFVLSPDEALTCLLVVGEVAPDQSAKEKMIRGAMHRRSKTIEQMTVADEPLPTWFVTAMKAVQKAPSALNRQPVTFTLQGAHVSAAIPPGDDSLLGVDLGIAKRHFALGAGGGTWQWGSGGRFTPSARLLGD